MSQPRIMNFVLDEEVAWIPLVNFAKARQDKALLLCKYQNIGYWQYRLAFWDHADKKFHCTPMIGESTLRLDFNNGLASIDLWSYTENFCLDISSWKSEG